MVKQYVLYKNHYTCFAFSTICSWLFVISHDVAALEAGSLTSFTTGWVGATIGAVDVFAVVVVVVAVRVDVGVIVTVVVVVVVVIVVAVVDNLSATGLAAIVVIGFGEPGTIGALPAMRKR